MVNKNGTHFPSAEFTSLRKFIAQVIDKMRANNELKNKRVGSTVIIIYLVDPQLSINGHSDFVKTNTANKKPIQIITDTT